MDDTVEYRHPTLSIVCRVSSYFRRIVTTRSSTVVVHLLVVVMIDDCCMHIHKLVQFVNTTYVAFLSCTVWLNDEIGTSLNSTLCLFPSFPVAAVDCYI